MPRYALYVVPDEAEDWARFCTGWLGWDIATGRAAPAPDIGALPLPLDDIVADPRRYGLHATVKPPFHLAEGETLAGLEQAAETLCAGLTPVRLDGLDITRLGRFLALTPRGDAHGLNALAARCVRDLDRFRAPPSGTELTRRRAARLTPAQEENLTRWGYPYVMDAFRFHITLTGRLAPDDLTDVRTLLERRLGPLLPTPWRIDTLALVEEGADGRFRLVRRFPLGLAD